MSYKATIIGAGSVGSTIAYTLAVQGTVTEIVMIDINDAKAQGEAMDIYQGTPFCDQVNIYAGTYEDARNSDVVIVTSGVARKPGQSRLDLAQTNVNIMKQIIPQIVPVAPDAVYIIVSNPVDVLTYQFVKYSGLKENQVIGSGTLLDTARLRSRLASIYNINKHNVHACMYGEHGDTSFVPWSTATISNIPVMQFDECLTGNMKTHKKLDCAEVEQYIRTSGGKIISLKGATFFAVAISVCHMVKCILNGSETCMTVSTMMHGEYGDIEDVCLSTMNAIGRSGCRGKIIMPLSETETALLHKSADSLKNVLAQIQF